MSYIKSEEYKQSYNRIKINNYSISLQRTGPLTNYTNYSFFQQTSGLIVDQLNPLPFINGSYTVLNDFTIATNPQITTAGIPNPGDIGGLTLICTNPGTYKIDCQIQTSAISGLQLYQSLIKLPASIPFNTPPVSGATNAMKDCLLCLRQPGSYTNNNFNLSGIGNFNLGDWLQPAFLSSNGTLTTIYTVNSFTMIMTKINS